MSEPDFIIQTLQRTHGGTLATSVLQMLRAKLMRRGFVLLPSDTCYSLAALAVDADSRTSVNAILSRQDEPISVAFHNYEHAQLLLELDHAAARLFENFTPGPITIVCQAKDNCAEDILRAIGSKDHTIGARIPDSIIEREIAACVPLPLMSIAVRDPKTRKSIRNFDEALRVVTLGIRKIGGAGWYAIQHDDDKFHFEHSTVVKVGGADRVTLLREGDIPLTDILESINTYSQNEMADWS